MYLGGNKGLEGKGCGRAVNESHSRSDEEAPGLSLDFAQEEGWRPMGCQVWTLGE